MRKRLNPDEKAKELVQAFINESRHEDFEALSVGKKCALICVDELLKFSAAHSFSIREDNDYWRLVKSEIQII